MSAASPNFAVVTLEDADGNLTQDEADIKTTREMKRAGELIMINVLDHVIVGESVEGSRGYASLRELGHFC